MSGICGGVHLENIGAIIRNTTISNNLGSGIIVSGPWISPPLIMDSSIVSGNYGDGISSDDLTANYCSILDNTGHGIVTVSGSTIDSCNIAGNSGYGVCNPSAFWLNAENNWWGDSTGPYHATANPGGLGDSVSDYVDFDPWLYSPWGVEEQPIVKPVEEHKALHATIFRGPLQLPKGKKCRVFDITGRVVAPDKIRPGIYFIEVDGQIVRKVVKVR